MSKLRVVQISESEFSVKGHGVHTAFVETRRGLEKLADVDVAHNSFRAADVRHIHTVGPYSLVQLLRSGTKVISGHVVPASFVGSLVGTKYWLWFAEAYLRWFYNRAAVVVAVSDATKDELRAIGVTSRIEVVHNMIDSSQYKTTPAKKRQARKKLGIPADAVVVTSNGQVQPRKRVDTFLKIARELPDMSFIWIGGMPFGKVAADSAKMQREIDSAPENVHFTGVVPLEEVRDYFAASDVFVSTSDQETFGIAIVEAAASGLPVVLRDIRDYDHTFRPDAVMCREEEFVEAIKKLSSDKKYYARMQGRALQMADRYDSEVVARKLVDIYRSSMSER